MGWYQLGKLKDAHSMHGEIYLLCFSGQTQWAEGRKTLKLAKRPDESRPWEPLEVTKFRPHKKGFVIKIKGVDHRTQAEELKGQLIAVPEDYVTAEKGEEYFLRELLGFSVIDKGLGEIGVVSGFGTNTVQDLICVDKGPMRLEVPLVDELVYKIDFKTKRILVDLPSGFADLAYEI